MKKIIAFSWLLLLGSCFFIQAQTPALPFPHHVAYTAGTIKPNTVTQLQLDSEVIAFYNAWKPIYLKAGCTAGQYYIEYVNGNEICVSEGQGYGMVIVAYMAGYDANAKVYYDGLYQWYQANPSTVNSTLMNWQQKTGCISDGSDAATDGDMDIAFSLLLADKQWGSSGTINYLQEALNIIGAIKQSEVFASVSNLQLGDWAHTDATYKDDTRPSDFMYDHLRAYKNATGDNTWNNVLNECYNLVDSMQTNFSAVTGLLPDFIEDCDGAPHPAAPNFLEGPQDGFYNYNSCRTPWHLGVDYLVNGDVRAKNACDKINSWLRSHVSNNINNIRSGYKLDGTNITGNNYQDMAFMAPFAVGACVNSTNQVWLNDLWDYVVQDPIGNSDYYGNTIKMLCMIVMVGVYWVPQTGTTAVSALKTNSQVEIYSNPSNGSFTIACPENTKQIQITNSLGEIVQSVEANSNSHIKLQLNESGFYFVTITTSGETITKKIIVSR